MPDAALPDAALPDAIAAGDSGTPDAIIVGDGGTPDAIVGDGGTPDAIIVTDGGTPDAIVTDGRTPDAIVGDGGTPDAIIVGDGGTPDAIIVGDGPTPDAIIVGDGGTPDAIIVTDGGIPDAVPILFCDPIAQTGCAAGAKCTWIVDIDATSSTPEIGHVGCAPDGLTVDGAACTDARATINGGVDTCVAGDLCVGGACKAICDPTTVSGSGPGSCTVNRSCVAFSGIFTSPTGPTAGVCEVNCDPLTQRLSIGGDEACGSPDPTRPIRTCVPLGSEFPSFFCAPSDPALYALTDRVAPLKSNGVPFVNGCAPGFIPFYLESEGSTRVLCSGMCAPVKVDADISVTHPEFHAGDPAAAGKLVADMAPMIGHATCLAGVKGSIAGDAQGNGVEDCRYLWFPLAAGSDPPLPVATPYNDTLGLCFDYNAFLTIDTDGDGFPDAAEKSCAQLPVTAPSTDPFGDARSNGCYPLAESTALSGNRHRIGSFRLSHGPATMRRHIFD